MELTIPRRIAIIILSIVILPVAFNWFSKSIEMISLKEELFLGVYSFIISGGQILFSIVAIIVALFVWDRQK